MGWTKVSERLWKRPVNGIEGYYVFMATASAALFDGRKNHTVFCKLKIETNIKTEDIE